MSSVAASRLIKTVASQSIRGVQRVAVSASHKRFAVRNNSWVRAFATNTSSSPSSSAVPEAEVIEPASTSSASTTQSTSNTDTTTATSAAPPIDVPPPLHNTETRSFQTETRQILDIVAHSLYTDKEVFMRELISNASDASEKLRYVQSSGQTIIDSDKPLEVRITSDETTNTITIQDYGIGMTREELVSHLGTIAKSGSKQFLQNLKDKGSGGGADLSNIIGQFGVGFYSTFMVADKVEVFTQPAVGNEPSHHWSSDGSGTYELSDTERCVRGTKVIVHLKESQKEFSNKNHIETIIRKYSNFVGYPIYLNNTLVNTVGAIWLQRPDTVTDQQHTAFYRYYGNAYDDPLYRLHLSVDAPIAIHALFYFPERHMEKYGMGRLEPGVNLYSRKILIKSKCKEVLPEWLRFIKGVVDSEDIPLNISRENMQDSRLLKRIYHVLTKKVLKYLQEESEKNPTKFKEFILEYGNFIKEGAISDPEYKIDCARLLRFDSSLETTNRNSTSSTEDKSTEEAALKSSGLVSLDDYISRMPPEQKHIYYLSAPSRAYALASPYYESFAKKHTEVLFLYQPIDDFVMKNVNEYNGRQLKSVESEIDSESKEDDEKNKTSSNTSSANNEEETKQLIDFMTTTLEDKISSIKATDRLSSSPAIIVSQESAAFRRMMRFVEQEGGALADMRPLPKQKMEINVKHPLLQSMSAAVRSGQNNQIAVAKMCCLQLFDLALLQADLMDNPRSMVNRISDIMATAMNGATSSSGASTENTSDTQTSTTSDHANTSTPDANVQSSTTTTQSASASA